MSADQVSNHEIPLLPLKDIVVFPHMIVPVFINEEICLNAVEFAQANQRKIFLSAFKFQATDEKGLESTLEAPFDVYDIGIVCTIMRTRKLPDGRMKVLVQGLHKATLKRLISTGPFPLVEITPTIDPIYAAVSPQTEAMVRAVRENLEKVVNLGKVLSPDILMILEDVKEPGRLSDLVAANLGLRVEDAQRILSVFDPLERLNRVHTFLSREIEVYQMQLRIQSQAKEEIGKIQREHYLREQIKFLKMELGDGDPKEDIDQMWIQFEKVNFSQEAKEEVSRQIKRLERMHQDTSEATLTRNYIETMMSLPWGTETVSTLDLKKVGEILDEDHFGLDQVKDRLIEYLAVKSLNPQAKSPIICFVGPPGVGKTSLGRSISKSMGRNFSRISLGGVRDEADIRGHRRTYVGAMPGRIIQSIKQARSCNPVIMLDEIDKLGADHRGDPAAALLEVLDPEQNHFFVDHYLGVSFDLSKVMFIANANTLDTIPAPLRDRLEVIEVSGYSEEEKSQIANRFLIPKQIKETGLNADSVNVSKDALEYIIRGYTRESGLRNLEKQIASVCRKIARDIAEQTTKQSAILRVTPAKVEKFLGARKYDDDFFHAEPAVGVSLGMAYTRYGGEILAIETNILDGRGKLALTGQLGDVMKESAHAALSYIRSKAKDFGIDQSLFKDKEMHVHIPQGAIAKDGPSAGVALVTSMISALTNQNPRPKTCMTGEITLHGKILPIGGLKEKLLAAKREGMEYILLPEKNRSNFEALPLALKKNLNVIFCSHYSEVFEILFKTTTQLPLINGEHPTPRLAS